MTALVDEDPGQPTPRYRSELSDDAKEQGTCVLSDEKREHRVVVIRPRLEEWIIKGAQETDVAMSRFGFSERGREFDDQVMLRLRRFEDLLDELLAQQCARLLRLRELLRG